jgi:hypothetical protein
MSEKTIAANVVDLDRRIEQADNMASRLRQQRREARARLHDEFRWSWRAVARLSGHNHYAVLKDARQES